MSGRVPIRIVLPQHLRVLANTGREVSVEADLPATIASALDALEARYPMLAGAIRDHGTKQRRPLVRFFAEQEDLSHESMDTALPRAVLDGREPLIILGAIAGG